MKEAIKNLALIGALSMPITPTNAQGASFGTDMGTEYAALLRDLVASHVIQRRVGKTMSSQLITSLNKEM